MPAAQDQEGREAYCPAPTAPKWSNRSANVGASRSGDSPGCGGVRSPPGAAGTGSAILLLGELARVQDALAFETRHLIGIRGFHGDRASVRRDELHLVCLMIAVDEHHRVYIAGDQSMLGQVDAKGRQLEFVQLRISHVVARMPGMGSRVPVAAPAELEALHCLHGNARLLLTRWARSYSPGARNIASSGFRIADRMFSATLFESFSPQKGS